MIRALLDVSRLTCDGAGANNSSSVSNRGTSVSPLVFNDLRKSQAPDCGASAHSRPAEAANRNESRPKWCPARGRRRQNNSVAGLPMPLRDHFRKQISKRSSCLVLTPAGAAFAGHFLRTWDVSSQPKSLIEAASRAGGPTAGHPNEPTAGHHLNGSCTAALKPCWNSRRRELCLGAQVVKRFRVPAQIQELILGAFQEDGWPGHIDDPLPRSGAIDPHTRLHHAIHRLNCVRGGDRPERRRPHRVLQGGDPRRCRSRCAGRLHGDFWERVSREP